MHRKRPSPHRFLLHDPPARPASRRADDDPWAGEDVDWEADEDRAHEQPTDFLRFFAAVAVAAVVSGFFWTGVVLFILWVL